MPRSSASYPWFRFECQAPLEKIVAAQDYIPTADVFTFAVQYSAKGSADMSHLRTIGYRVSGSKGPWSEPFRSTMPIGETPLGAADARVPLAVTQVPSIIRIGI